MQRDVVGVLVQSGGVTTLALRRAAKQAGGMFVVPELTGDQLRSPNTNVHGSVLLLTHIRPPVAGVAAPGRSTLSKLRQLLERWRDAARARTAQQAGDQAGGERAGPSNPEPQQRQQRSSTRAVPRQSQAQPWERGQRLLDLSGTGTSCLPRPSLSLQPRWSSKTLNCCTATTAQSPWSSSFPRPPYLPPLLNPSRLPIRSVPGPSL